jgi:AraC-like DNA-binding protein
MRKVAGRGQAGEGEAVSGQLSFRLQERLDFAQSLTLKDGDSDIHVGRYRCDRDNLGVIAPTTLSDQVMFVVDLRPRGAANIWCEGLHIRQAPSGPGSLKVFDLRQAWQAELLEPFDTVNLLLPRRMLETMEDEVGRAIAVNFPDPGRPARADPIYLDLASALAKALAAPEAPDPLFVGYVVEAMKRRLAGVYGRAEVGVRPRTLAAWQLRRVRELMLEDLTRTPALGEMAAACGLSNGHFARAFKRTMGMPPHRWLVEQRVARAQELLLGTDLLVSDIAAACGFADQSHLTRAFVRKVGAPPAFWRRNRQYRY